MPSTYSNLKIQLMATGENSTTWGTVTNTNLGTAIEEAIVGSADVVFASGNVTLTLSDTNGTQPARNMRLNLTGTTGGATRNLVVPSIEKPYIVNNGCADSVVVKTAAGTGVTVPPGKTMWVYSDGTNVVDVATHLTDLTLSTPLAVASGGLGNNTGSGAALTNLNASSISSGTLALARGGTGASTNSAARVNLLPSYTGNAGKILALNTGGTDVEWVSAGGAGTVTSVNATTAISGLSFSGGPITSAGTLTLSGTLGVQGGGTGQTTLTAGAVLTGNGTSAIGSVSPGASGNVLTSNGTAWVSSAPAAGGTVTSVSGTGSVNGITLSGTVTSSGSLTLGGSLSNVSLTTQVTGTLPLGNGGTGSTTASGARTNLGLGSLATANSVSLTTQVSGTLPLGNGGTGATTASGARTNLELGSLATASSVDLASQVTSTLAIANGGTGATTASAALAALGALGVSASSLSSSGYVKLSNGLYIMWGSFTASGNGSTTYSYSTISGSISLSSFSVSITSGGPSGGGDNPPHTTSCTTTGFTVYNAFSSSVTTFFIAVGV